METFRHLVNDCLRIGLANDIATMKRLCKLCYPALNKYEIISYYKLHAISKAAGILKNRRQSIRRSCVTKKPYMKHPMLVSCYGFRIGDGVLKVPLGHRRYFDIKLNSYVKSILSDPTITARSFTLVANSVSISYCKQVIEIECDTIIGIDRNLTNVTYGNSERVIMFDVSGS